ncbi:Glucan endo-1,3-beta-glucosidase 1 [Acorus calamus]|uniref:Glucan endo-1,3-beta-glucosidase 1 n=1 Tax=Acorus calamus TaxID=4465 RepID=A0AAV9CYX2_ACOCL|nr:Glucan endo-1,3-beta-glucosidase 1 [Acorus calamus]
MSPSMYIYELFDGDLRPRMVSEVNWGMFGGNRTPAYLLHVEGTGWFLANDTINRAFCVAVEGADSKSLQAALDWACGLGSAHCSEIQSGMDCYGTNTHHVFLSYGRAK